MIDNETKQYVQQQIAQAQKEALYSIKNASYHTHNGSDSPKIINSSGSVNASGPGTNTTIAASFTPTVVPVASADFANGITYDSSNKRFKIVTAGQYIIAALLYYNNPTSVGASYQIMVYKNGSVAFQGYSVCATSGIAISQAVTKILDLSVGDYIELYGQTGSSSTQATGGSLSWLSLAQV